MEAAEGFWRDRSLLYPILLAAVLYILSAGNRGVIDYDEGYYSQPAVRMAETGDWVTPYANGVRFLEKPPLMYWVTAASLRLFGRTELALRLPSALAVIALVVIVTLIARRACGKKAAEIAALATALCPGTFLFTREALHDIWLVLFVTLAMYAFLEWYSSPRLGFALLFYTAAAAAVMCKSLVGLAFPIGIAVLFFLLSWKWPQWRTLHLLPGSLLFLGLTVPWHWAAAVKNSNFLYDFFVNEQFLRFVNRHDPPVVWSIPLLTFWSLILIWFFPWTAFIPAAFAGGRHEKPSSEAALRTLVVAWLIVILGFFSISGRLEHYAFPILPALALMVAPAMANPNPIRAVQWGFRGLAALGFAVFLLAAAGAAWFFAGGQDLARVIPGRAGIVYESDFSILADLPTVIMLNLLKPAAITVLALAAGFGAALWLENKGRRMQAMAALSCVMVVVFGMTHWSLVICDELISSKKFGVAIARESRHGDRLVVMGDYESANSLNFYQPLPVQVSGGVAYALIPGLKYEDAPKVVLSRKELEEYWRSAGRMFAILPSARVSELHPKGREMLKVLDRVLVLNH